MNATKTKTKLRRGIGGFGRHLQYVTAYYAREDRDEKLQPLNKHPEFRRAAKKSQRRTDIRLAQE